MNENVVALSNYYLFCWFQCNICSPGSSFDYKLSLHYTQMACKHKWCHVYLKSTDKSLLDEHFSRKIFMTVKLTFEMLTVRSIYFRLTDGCSCESVKMFETENVSTRGKRYIYQAINLHGKRQLRIWYFDVADIENNKNNNLIHIYMNICIKCNEYVANYHIHAPFTRMSFIQRYPAIMIKYFEHQWLNWFVK